MKLGEAVAKGIRDYFNKELASTTIDVGILDGSMHDSKSGLSTASLAAIHTYGNPKLPRRPFLEPGIRKMNISSIDPDSIGQEAVRAVNEEFETSGHGSWAPPARDYGHPLLIDTGVLKNAIDYRVSRGGGNGGNN